MLQVKRKAKTKITKSNKEDLAVEKELVIFSELKK